MATIRHGMSIIKRQHGRAKDKREKDEEEQPPSTASFRGPIALVTQPWFAVTMSTSTLGVVAQTIIRFTSPQTSGNIFLILDIILFILFTRLIVTHIILVPQKLAASLHHPVEGLAAHSESRYRVQACS
ncbi:hypothetical protein K469DRAFT_752969 [Zopfia rhizophila CBS 207.26]|uniref:Uncharacterized protein n=1 Tax=Zopfia rhizophila CBS 207.26 TaxID=1314779 RepID=A0A6A6DTY1_9PEZI|nr:hypothetical protein K469DRAFT_752969 [Zopfia rhizophila CBS 207.26]